MSGNRGGSPRFAAIVGHEARMSFVNPGRGTFQFSQRRNALAFWIGSAVGSVSVGLHLPMFSMAPSSRFHHFRVPMGAGTPPRLLLVVARIAPAGYGLFSH